MQLGPTGSIPSGTLSKGALNRRWCKTTELALNEPGKGNRTAIFQVPANDLYADREAAFASTVRHCRRGQPVQRRDAGPGHLVAIGDFVAIDVKLTAALRSVVVREGQARHRWTKHDIDLLKEVEPLASQYCAHAARADPFRVIGTNAAQPVCGKTLIFG